MQNRDLLANSTHKNIFLSLIVDKIPITFIKTYFGNICITVPEDSLSYTVSNSIINLLKMEEKLWDEIVVGRVNYTCDEFGATYNSWPIINDAKLDHFVEKSLGNFWQLVDNYGLWSTFNSFLIQNIKYDAEVESSEEQLSFEYFWLTGPLNDSNLIMECSIYQDGGVFIRPEDKLVPIFSNSLFADMCAYEYSKNLSLELTPEHIGCLGCFLSGLSGELGREVIYV